MDGVQLHALVQEQAHRTPERLAVTCGDMTLTYAELNARANRLAHYLIARGAAAEEFVALALPRSVDLAVTLLAVLKSGAAYLPVDPQYPADRIGHMLADARPALLITTKDIIAGWAVERPARTGLILIDDPVTATALGNARADDPQDADRLVPAASSHPAYVIYTSGSSGRPKGVVIEHRSLSGYLAWTSSAYQGARGLSLVPTSFSFDLTVTGLYTPWLVGGCVRLVGLDRLDDDPAARAAARQCSFMKVTPSHLAVLGSLPAELAPSTELVLGGEALTADVVSSWRRRHPGTTVINAYGPTEATVNCAEYRIEPGQPLGAGPVPIGRAQPGAIVRVLDDDLQPVPAGGTGEIYIGGSRLARGYLRRPALTAERFVPDPYGTGTRLYRSGDLGRIGPDGNIVFAGRSDQQVKVRGYRVELGDVEAVLTGHPQVGRVACAVRGPTPTTRRIVAYAVARGDDPVTAAALRDFAAQLLPSYMVPAAVVFLPALPQLPNGKVDRAALPGADERGDPPGPASLIVPLRMTAGGTPLFCVHPETGDSGVYARLPDHLPAPDPVYGIDLPPDWPGQVPDTVADLASLYVGQLRQAWPRGPYRLLGWSFGGLMAYAMATLLRSGGHEVSLLALIDAYPAVRPRPGEQEDGGAEDDLAALLRFASATGTGKVGAGPENRTCDARLAGATVTEAVALAGRFARLARLGSEFRPGGFDGDVVFFIARPPAGQRTALAWSPHVTGRIEVHDLARAGSPPWPDVIAAVGSVLSGRPNGPIPH